MALKKHKKNGHKTLPLCRLYLDDLIEVEQILTSALDKVEIDTTDAEADKVEELEAEDKMTPHIRFGSCLGPITVTLDRRFACITEFDEENNEIMGVVSRLSKLFTRCRRPVYRLTKPQWVIGLSAATGLFITLIWAAIKTALPQICG